MSKGSFITPKKECSTCDFAAYIEPSVYAITPSKYPFVCFHPSTNRPKIRKESLKGSKKKMLNTSKCKLCPLLE